MGIENVFTKKNIEIFKLLDKESMHIREIADTLNISPAKVIGAVKTLKKFDLIIEETKKNRKIIALNKNKTYKKKH